MKLKWILDFIVNNLNLIIFALLFIPIIQMKRKFEQKTKKAKIKLKKSIQNQSIEPSTLHPEIDPNLCSGCGTCTKVCPEGDILGLINNKAVLVTPSKCVGHGECEVVCPMNAIKLVFGTKTRGMDIPRLNSSYETNVPGLYIAGELGGMGLIRNATKQGALAAENALANLSADSNPEISDLFIVGAGPAGLAAGLVAIEKKRSYVLIDQNTFGGTVTNFPRQKLVMSHPFKLPIFGEVRFKTHQIIKEDLLNIWNQMRLKTKLVVKEKINFESLEKKDKFFEIKTNKGLFKAKKVILAMGVRGTPRRLGLVNEDLPKVTYNLIDAAQYQNQDIVVVGGGNAGVEAAQMLAAKKLNNRVKLLVRGKAFDRCNEENMIRINKMEKDGLVKIWYNSSVNEIHQEHLIVLKESESLKIPNHYLFIFAGAEMPYKFLMSLGVQIEKKFGAA